MGTLPWYNNLLCCLPSCVWLVLTTLTYPKSLTYLVYSLFFYLFLSVSSSLRSTYFVALKSAYSDLPLLSSLYISSPLLNFLVVSVVFTTLLHVWFYKYSRWVLLTLSFIVCLKATGFFFLRNKFWPYYNAYDNLLLLNSINTIHPLVLYLSALLLVLAVYAIFSVVIAKKPSCATAYNIFLALLGNQILLILLPCIAALLGCFWANQVGTWGGWWVWDPSEILIITLFLVLISTYHFIPSRYCFINFSIIPLALFLSLGLYQAYCFKFLENTLHSFFSTITVTTFLILQPLALVLIVWQFYMQVCSITKPGLVKRYLLPTWTKLPLAYMYLSLPLALALVTIVFTTTFFILVSYTLILSLLYTLLLNNFTLRSRYAHVLVYYVTVWLLFGLLRLDFLWLPLNPPSLSNLITTSVICYLDLIEYYYNKSQASSFAFTNLYLYFYNSSYTLGSAYVPSVPSLDLSLYFTLEILTPFLSLFALAVFICYLKITLIG